MKKTFDRRGVALLLLVFNLIIHNVSASIKPHQGSVFSGRSRMLRKVSSAPPPPKLGKIKSYVFLRPPPPPLSTLQISGIDSSLRTVRRGSPPAPKPSRPRNFFIFPSPPPPLPPPPPARMHKRPSKCNVPPPPPPEST
ncbi:hypothetical protein Hdeb2414_s0095g00790911 [Helianthus debilis subsp. tardiflorus]